MELIDSSSWIEALRASGKADVRDRVKKLLASGDAGWCNIVRLELWHGARGELERKALRELDGEVANLAIDDEVWEKAMALAVAARDNGLTVPVADLIIVACAVRHGVGLEHNDKHMMSLQGITPGGAP